MKAGAQGAVDMPWALLFFGSIKRDQRRHTVYICLCRGIRETTFREIVVRNEGRADRVKKEMWLDETCCGRCEGHLDVMIQELGVSRYQHR